jgi:hypothetical protein
MARDSKLSFVLKLLQAPVQIVSGLIPRISWVVFLKMPNSDRLLIEIKCKERQTSSSAYESVNLMAPESGETSAKE